MESFDWTTLSPKELAEHYLKFREAKSQYEEQVNYCKAVMEEIQAAILEYMQATGTESFRVDGVATVTRTTKTNVSCADWNTLFTWMLDRAEELRSQGSDPTQVFAFLQKRVSSTAVKEFMEMDANNAPPPAVNVMPEYGVSVRISK